MIAVSISTIVGIVLNSACATWAIITERAISAAISAFLLGFLVANVAFRNGWL